MKTKNLNGKNLKAKNLRVAFGTGATFAIALFTSAFASADSTVSRPVTELKYFASGVKNKTGELYVASAYGDLKGKHGTFVKMPAGFVSDVHTHSHDYYAVVISGVGVNIPVGGKDLQLPVGSYWLQKGGEAHVTKCISPNECIFFINQADAFDYVPTKK